MNFEQYFKNAAYVSSLGNYYFPYIRKKFDINKQTKSATLYFSALGFAEIYLNGKKITEDKFITPHTMYNKQIPNEFYINPGSFDEEYFSDELGYSIAVSRFDVTDLLNDGLNAFGVILSGGWYYPQCDKYLNYRNFGRPKTCFNIQVTYTDGTEENFVSDARCSCYESFIIRGSVFREEIDERKEIHDFSLADFDDSKWMRVGVYAPPKESKFNLNTCPADKIVKYLKPELVKVEDGKKIYALKENTTGYPIILTDNSVGDTIIVKYGEELDADGNLDEFHCYTQESTCVTDGRTEHHIRFTWYGFQYFSIETTGNLDTVSCDRVAVIRADIQNTSEFKCNIDVVNYLYDTYIRTQLLNYHCGLPCDCPQIEKRGYTGDGQLLMPLGLKLFDSENLYRKWLNDISDVQDRKSGFVHNTAPVYVSCAGGPGGWSAAIINAPYYFYLQYGDKSVLERFYPQMLKFVEFIEDEAVDSLVTIHKRKAHCLGDWSGPYKPYLPEPFANTCLYVDALRNLIAVSEILDEKKEIQRLNALIDEHKKAINDKYFDEKTGNYCGNEQGSNAFALDIGLGDERTLINLNEKYDQYGGFDTGIFGTKILPKILFEKGYGDTALKLYTSENEASFKKWMDWGETTLRESWFNTRSHNHPMFGAPVLFLFEQILGIRQKKDSVAYKSVIINPQVLKDITDVSGSLLTPQGRISVSYTKKDGKTEFTVVVPDGIDCEFNYGGKEVKLNSGKNEFTL